MAFKKPNYDAVFRELRKQADDEADKLSLSYPYNVTKDDLGYVRYDIYPYRGDKRSHQAYTHMNLHMPAEVTDALASEWAAETDVLKAAMATSKRVSELTENLAATDGDKKAITGQVVAATVEGMDALGSTAESVLKIPGLDMLTSGTMRRKRKAVNPHEVHAFKGVSFRTFEFTHKLIPYNPEEAKNIRQMLHWFKFFAAPGKSSTTHLTYPAEWNIGFYNKYGLNQFLPQINKCVLTEVSINFAGSSTWSMHYDGSPVDMEITLSFQETVLPTRDVIKKERVAWNENLSAGTRNKNIDDLSEGDNYSLGDILGENSLIGKNIPEDMKATTKDYYSTWKSYLNADEPKQEF
jgi:hypothetical protein